MSRDHRKLRAFQLADEFVIAVYGATKTFPKDELYGITSQLRRASVSVPANIVEGCARPTEADYIRFLSIALASLREAGYLLSLAHRLGYLPNDQAATVQAMYDETARVLSGLISALRSA